MIPCLYSTFVIRTVHTSLSRPVPNKLTYMKFSCLTFFKGFWARSTTRDTQQNLSVGSVVPSVLENPDSDAIEIEPISSEKDQFRVLIIGKANAGKTSILQRVCDTTDSPEIYTLDSDGNRKQVCSRPYSHFRSDHLSRFNSILP